MVNFGVVQNPPGSNIDLSFITGKWALSEGKLGPLNSLFGGHQAMMNSSYRGLIAISQLCRVEPLTLPSPNQESGLRDFRGISPTGRRTPRLAIASACEAPLVPPVSSSLLLVFCRLPTSSLQTALPSI